MPDIPQDLTMAVGCVIGVVVASPVMFLAGCMWYASRLERRAFTAGVVRGAPIAAHTETRGTPVTPLPVPESDEEAFGGGWAS